MPLVFALLLIASEALLKKDTAASAVQPYALAVFALSLSFFVYYFFRQKNVWEKFLEPRSVVPHSPWVVVGILSLAALFRFWRLGTLADGMAWDEAYKGLDALAIREFGERPVFLNWNAGREALIAYLVAASQYLFDCSIVSVRAVLAVAGVLTVWIFYLFTRRIFHQPFALMAAFLLAVSKWHIIHTRYAVRVGLIVLFEMAVLYFLIRGIQTPRRNSWWFVPAGAIGGLGLYTYIAYRIFPIIVLFLLFEKNVRMQLRHHLLAIGGGILAALLVAAPLLHFYWIHKQSFTDRMQRTAVWKTRGTKLTPAELVMDSVAKTFGLFTYAGDEIDRNNVAGEPMLTRFSSSFFVLGFLMTLICCRKPYGLFLLAYFFFTILPGILSVNAPHASRTLGAVIPATLFVTFGIFVVFEICRHYSQHLSLAFLTLMLMGNLYSGPNDGLLRYAEALDRLDAKTSALWGLDRDQYRVVDLINRTGDEIEVYLTPQLYFHASVEYLTYSKSKHQLFTFGSKLQPGKPALIIMQLQECNLWWLRDDDGKQFFKWWAQKEGRKVKDIRAIVTRSYISASRTTRMSDLRLLRHLRDRYPNVRELRLGNFNAYLLHPNRPTPEQQKN